MIVFYVASFFGGAFFTNAIPHFVQGLSGRKFPSPFSKPPGRGESSALVNVLWGAFNFVVAYYLLCKVADFNFHDTLQACVTGLGSLAIGIMTAVNFSKVYSK